MYHAVVKMHLFIGKLTHTAGRGAPISLPTKPYTHAHTLQAEVRPGIQQLDALSMFGPTAYTPEFPYEALHVHTAGGSAHTLHAEVVRVFSSLMQLSMSAPPHTHRVRPCMYTLRFAQFCAPLNVRAALPHTHTHIHIHIHTLQQR